MFGHRWEFQGEGHLAMALCIRTKGGADGGVREVGPRLLLDRCLTLEPLFQDVDHLSLPLHEFPLSFHELSLSLVEAPEYVDAVVQLSTDVSEGFTLDLGKRGQVRDIRRYLLHLDVPHICVEVRCLLLDALDEFLDGFTYALAEHLDPVPPTVIDDTSYAEGLSLLLDEVTETDVLNPSGKRYAVRGSRHGE